MKNQENSDAEKQALKAEIDIMKEKLSLKETEVQREVKRRQKTHIELMDVRYDLASFFILLQIVQSVALLLL